MKTSFHKNKRRRTEKCGDKRYKDKKYNHNNADRPFMDIVQR